MTGRIHYSSCPLCGSAAIREVFTAKDHLVSGEFFRIDECGNCTLRFTQDVPDAAGRTGYYKSENYISHSDTSAGWINRLYQMARSRTMISKRKLIEQTTGLRRGNLLDIGSGTGTFVHTLKLRGWSITGIEPDEGARNLAKRKYGLDLLPGSSINDLPAQTFDAITLWHVLEHIEDPSAYMQRVKNLLKVTGRIFIAVPNYLSYDAWVYKNFWAAYDVPRHLWHFSPQAMKFLSGQNSLKIEKYKTMWYDSFYISLLSSKYRKEQFPGRQGRHSWISAVWTGIISNIYALRHADKCSSVIYVMQK